MAQIVVACNNSLLTPSKGIMDEAEGQCSQTKDISKNEAVSFTVDFDEPAKNPRRMPKNLRNRRKRELSEASLAEKQKLAEERRKKHLEDRLERIHQLEEEAQRLAQAMAPLLKATQANGQPPRKLHKDNDAVNSTAGSATCLEDTASSSSTTSQTKSLSNSH